MDHCEVEVCQVKEPAGLSTVQCLEFTEVSEVFMISENLDGKRRAMEVISPGFEGTDNCQQFVAIDIIILFCWREGLKKVRAGMPLAVQVGLEEDGT